MSYLLDTDICIYVLNKRDEKLESVFRERAASGLSISTLTEAELHYGALHSARPEANAQRIKSFLMPLAIIPFDSRAAQVFAQIKESLVKAGTPIGVMDTLIAAIAKAHELILVSNNLKHFGNIQNLRVENWSQRSV